MKTKKKLMLLMAMLLTALTVTMPLQIKAAEVTTSTEAVANALGCGLKPIEMVKISDEEALEMSRENADVDPATDDVDPVDEMTDEEIQEELFTYVETKASHATDASAWGAYCCDAIYNNMSAAEKQFYDNMYADCLSYLTTNKNSSGMTDGAAYSGLSEDQVKYVAFIFNFLNPQFYFLDNGIGYSGTTLQWGIYGAFRDGSARAAATNNLFATVNNYMAQINAQNSDYNKLKVAHDLIALNTTYTGSTYDQSCYGPLMTGQAVCAGYAEAYELLCNKAGIPTIAVTSTGHEWNQVYLNNNWYLVDVTWDDADNGSNVYYDYFLKSDATVKAEDSYSSSSHTLESCWAGYGVRPCLYDWPAPNGGASQSMSNVDLPIVKDGMYRVYNPFTGEHLYTKDRNEGVVLTSQYNWEYEGIAWTSASSGRTPVYRLYNSRSGEHFYTMDPNEKNVLVTQYRWDDEGIGFYSDDRHSVPVYRLFNPNAPTAVSSHHFTTNAAERDALVSQYGWEDEGICWYGK